MIGRKDILPKCKIEKFAKSLCDLDQEDPHLYEDHVQLVIKYAVELAKIEKADILCARLLLSFMILESAKGGKIITQQEELSQKNF